MVVGVPKEIKNNEFRVAMTPAGVLELVNRGHEVVVEQNAGLGSGFEDVDYVKAGAKILSSADEVFGESMLIVKVKEPLPSEYSKIQPHHTVFTYFHLAASQELTEAMIDSRATCIAYETLEGRKGDLPLLTPMSQVAGRMAVQEGARYLTKPLGGSGVLLGGVSGVKPGKVLIIGGGVVGAESAKIAAGMGARVSIVDINVDRLNYLSEILPGNVTTLFSNTYNISNEIKDADLLIGAVLIPGGKAPRLVTKEMIQTMRSGSVVVDVAVDQGGCIETCHPTTHENPTFEVGGVIHYGVANIPGAVPRTSTEALTNATLPYVVELAHQGFETLAEADHGFAKAINIVNGRLTNREVALAFNLEFTPVAHNY